MRRRVPGTVDAGKPSRCSGHPEGDPVVSPGDVSPACWTAVVGVRRLWVVVGECRVIVAQARLKHDWHHLSRLVKTPSVEDGSQGRLPSEGQLAKKYGLNCDVLASPRQESNLRPAVYKTQEPGASVGPCQKVPLK